MSAIYQVPTSNNQQYTLDSNYTAGGATLVLSQDVSSTVQAPGVVCIDRVDTNGNKTPTKRTYYYFTGVSTSTLTGVSLADGSDQAHSVGAIVEFVPDVKWAQSIYDALSNVVVPSTGAVDTTKVATPTGIQTLTNKTLTTPVIASFYQDAGKTKLMTTPNTASDTLAAIAATQTLTNKRWTRRVVATTQAAEPAVNTDNGDIFEMTEIAQAITSMTTNLSGTPSKGDKIEIWFTDDGTARAITWGASFESTTITLPTTTVISTRLRVGLEWSGAKWSCIASA